MDKETEQKDGDVMIEYPKMIYHPVLLPMVVYSVFEDEAKKAEGWMESPLPEGSLSEIKAQIEIKEQELATLKEKYNLIMEALNDGDPGKDTFICPICQKAFSKRVALIGHMRSHNK